MTKGETARSRVHRAIAESDTRIFETSSCSLPPNEADKIRAEIRHGAHLVAQSGGYDADGPIVGFDFGTSSVKVVARKWYAAGRPAFALEVPGALRSGNVPHLWRTSLWVGENGALSILPMEAAAWVDGFKAALITGRPTQYQGSSITPAEAATAFLALHLARLFGILATSAAIGPSAGFRRIHFGIPVATMQDKPRVSRFEHVVRTALALVPKAPTLTIDDLRQMNPPNVNLPLNVFPELAGIVAGYSESPDRVFGAHMILDCGAATLDIASFNLVDGPQGNRVSAFEAQVATLGSEAIRWAEEGGASQQDFLAACHELDRLVFVTTAQRRAPAEFSVSDPRNVQVVTVGGGFASALHQQFVSGFPSFYGRPLLRPQAAGAMACDANTDYARLLLADGLARDPVAIPEFRSPSQIEDIARPRLDYSANFVGPEHM